VDECQPLSGGARPAGRTFTTAANEDRIALRKLLESQGDGAAVGPDSLATSSVPPRIRPRSMMLPRHSVRLRPLFMELEYTL